MRYMCVLASSKSLKNRYDAVYYFAHSSKDNFIVEPTTKNTYDQPISDLADGVKYARHPKLTFDIILFIPETHPAFNAYLMTASFINAKILKDKQVRYYIFEHYFKPIILKMQRNTGRIKV